jgi:protein tyrosine phosphatase (PTP) superfamily phosphohydrolase (DUF442 family)
MGPRFGFEIGMGGSSEPRKDEAPPEEAPAGASPDEAPPEEAPPEEPPPEEPPADTIFSEASPGDAPAVDASAEAPFADDVSSCESAPAEMAPAAEKAPPSEESPSAAGLAMSMGGRGLRIEVPIGPSAGPGFGGRKYTKWVAPGILMRGSAPDARMLDQVRSEGVKTVVNLGKADPKWKASVEKLGMRPIALTSLGDALLTEDEVQAFLDLVRDSNNWPIFVHCEDGVERTGALCAVYRIAREGAGADAAIAEAKQAGMRSAEQEAFIRQFAADVKAGVYELAPKKKKT